MVAVRRASPDGAPFSPSAVVALQSVALQKAAWWKYPTADQGALQSMGPQLVAPVPALSVGPTVPVVREARAVHPFFPAGAQSAVPRTQTLAPPLAVPDIHQLLPPLAVPPSARPQASTAVDLSAVDLSVVPQ